ncbi:alpha/beta hydrolase [Nocardioides sp. TF02-7]|uniref:alpha/beta fold hydrolase n=1 Tax=Nocardioides sp. TF02-7 TaxID=2917724 RepID=UPI001F067F74|nr:alpha/beta hydrolase [Nocardioides sp. TF02-7]UMG93285.1 alpha/beta hydrolase [Nocardioides sp. TF02-7]
MVIAVLLAAAYGAAVGVTLPRGPVTTGGALTTLVVSVAVGLVAGYLTRTRWAMLIAPLVFAAAFELVRAGASGPTVDGIRLTSTYGALAFVVGRGFLALMTLAPIALGAVMGAGAARAPRTTPTSHGWSRSALYLRRAITATLAVALVAFGALLARPAQTEPILGVDGEPLPDSVAELTSVEIDGHDLGLMIRGHDVDNPVLLFLAGGPGGSELGAMRRHAEGLEEDFVVATFDQRGTGRSHGELEPTDTLTLDRAVADVIEVAHHLRDRFDQEQIYLVGQSWGATLGVLAVQADPALFEAFVGVGQMVSQRETDRIFYQDTLAWAQREGDQDLVDQLTEIGPPPYDDVADYEIALSHEHQVYSYDHSANAEGQGGFSENLFVEEYTLLEQVHALGAFLDVFATLYPQLQDIDFRVDAVELDVPVYLVQGRHEARGRSELAEEWFGMLQAPHKELIVLDTSGHRPIFEQPDEFHDVMVNDVLPDRLTSP